MGLPDNLDALEREASTLASTDGAETLVRKERFRDLIGELRAARAVVEAARAYVERIEAEAAECEPWNAPELDRGICTAVAEYDRLTGERPPEGNSTGVDTTAYSGGERARSSGKTAR